MVTLYLATVIGWYLVIMGVYVLFRYDHLRPIMTEFLNHRALLLVLAIITLILGLLMVASHNIWVLGWPLIVTLFSWLVLISGLFRLFFPDSALHMGEYFLRHPIRMKITSVIFLIIGLFLLFNVYAQYF